MSLPNEVSATLTLWGWREGPATGGRVASGGMVSRGGSEGVSPPDSAWHALGTQSLGAQASPFLLQSSNPAIHDVSLQNHRQAFGHRGFPGKTFDVQH